MLLGARRSATDDRPLVGEPERRLAVAEPGGDDARHLRSHVRAEDGDLSGLRLDEAQDVVGGRGSEPALEHAGELERRRRHEEIAVQREALEDRARQIATTRRLFRQEVAHPRW